MKNFQGEIVTHEWIFSASFEKILKKSEKTLLYFYPKDNTPGCTTEANDFSQLAPEFEALGIQIIGVSKDSSASHAKFIENQMIAFELISDPNLELHKYFWAYGEKNNYGKIVQWVIRSTFLLDQEGNILKEYRNVRAKWHAQRVLNDLDI